MQTRTLTPLALSTILSLAGCSEIVEAITIDDSGLDDSATDGDGTAGSTTSNNESDSSGTTVGDETSSSDGSTSDTTDGSTGDTTGQEPCLPVSCEWLKAELLPQSNGDAICSDGDLTRVQVLVGALLSSQTSWIQSIYFPGWHIAYQWDDSNSEINLGDWAQLIPEQDYDNPSFMPDENACPNWAEDLVTLALEMPKGAYTYNGFTNFGSEPLVDQILTDDDAVFRTLIAYESIRAMEGGIDTISVDAFDHPEGNTFTCRARHKEEGGNGFIGSSEITGTFPMVFTELEWELGTKKTMIDVVCHAIDVQEPAGLTVEMTIDGYGWRPHSEIPNKLNHSVE